MSANSTNSTAGAGADFNPADLLPPYLNLPPHLSAHKYFFVCTLTVAAWDTLVLCPRTYRLWRAKDRPRPLLYWAFFILRILMPIEFTIVAVAFFDIHWTRDMCQHFFLFEPILTAILVSICSAVHLIRIRAIYDKSNEVTATLGILLTVQVVLMAIACGFFHVVPVEDPSQGCIAGPKHNWVGIYWVGATLFYTTTFALALARSFQSRAQKPLGLWKLMLRDGLNLYGAIWIVNMVNMLFWFIVKPTGPEDTIRTIVTSMAAVLTMTMTMRIILSIRGTLVNGGSFAGSPSGQSASGTSRSHSQGRSNIANTATNQGQVFSINPATSQVRQTYTLEEMRSKSQWEQADDGDGKSSLTGAQAIIGDVKPETGFGHEDAVGVKVTVERDFE